MSGSQTCGRGLSGMRIPFACVRITPDTAPSSIHLISSSGVSRFSNSEKKPPMSEPQVLTPDSPIVSPLVTTERSPSKPQSDARVAAPDDRRAARGPGPARAHERGRPRGRGPGGAVVLGRIEVVQRGAGALDAARASSGVYSPKSSIQPS